MTNLISLDLSYNCLTKICLKGLSYLEYLNLTGNKLVTISNDSFSDMYNLKKLILRCNQLECLNDTAFKCLNKLEHLDLSWNKLSSTNCIECLSSSLLELNLSHNKLSSLEANVLSSLVNLEKLNLDCNLIKSFYLCGSNSRLCILSLAFNQIISIDTNTLNRLTKLKELNLYANPIDVSNY
jgi:Leucine-rich repeat (LRR) protein